MKNQFLSNTSKISFLDKLKKNLENCASFRFSISFIKKAGLDLIKKEIEEALKRNVIGQIITSTYQNFTDIPSLELFFKWMKAYPNFKCHLDYNSFNGFHSKGYLFEFNDSFELIIGSSNLTRYALLKNVEWNVSILNKNTFDSYDSALLEFNYLWDNTYQLNEDLINDYQIQISYAIEKWDMDYETFSNTIKPNFMQKKALKEIRRYRDLNVKKALIIAATGSGKTYLAAFDTKNFDAKRLLFVVHRETILNDALNSFQKVFGQSRTYGKYSGSFNQTDADFLFATNTMLSNHLDLFSKDEFDYLIIDECHHIIGSTYQKIINYFNPAFLLGLTATPERMDKNDVYAAFEANVPFELRLRDALVHDLIVPFNYYGIRDQLVNYSDKNTNFSRELVNINHCAFIDKEIKKHLPLGKLKAIVFCKTIEHATKMAFNMSSFGYNTKAITSNNDFYERNIAFNELQNDDCELEMIFTVDVLNEGVDIPSINMVIFLRPTESSTIFIQQLGRGLRKYKDKKYLTVLDFIGNSYKRSTQIALALANLSSNHIIEKQYLKDLVRSDFSCVNELGVNIYIDALSKEEILKYIDETNFNRLDVLKQDYYNFKKYINCQNYPTHMDFLNNDYAPDLLRLMKSKINNKKNYSYYNFLRKIGEEKLPHFEEDEVSLLNRVSNLLPLVRIDEYLIIKELVEGNPSVDFLNTSSLKHARKMLENESIITNNLKLTTNSTSPFFKEFLLDLLDYGITRYNIDFFDFSGTFKLYHSYYIEQIMRLLHQNSIYYMQGAKYGENDDIYLFVGLKKDEKGLHNYSDKFIDSKTFQWESVNNTTIDSAEGIKLQKIKVVHLFIRKMDEEDGITLPFTYFGTGVFTNRRPNIRTVVTKDGREKEVPTLLFDIILDNEVREDLKLDFIDYEK